MAQTINADDGVISGSTGFKFTADTTGIMALQTNGTTRVTVDASGNVGIGGVNSFDISPTGTGQYPMLGVWGTSNPIQQGWGYFGGATTSGCNVVYVKSRGSTVGLNTAVVSGDVIANIIFRGADGTNYRNVANIQGAVDGVVSTGIVPGRLIFQTADSAGTNTERMRIDSSGRTTFTGLIYHSAATMAAAGTTQGTATAITAQFNNVTTGIDGTAGVILPAPAAAGLRIFIRNGSASLSLRIYPHSGGNIAGTGVNASIEIEFATVLEFIAFDTTDWYLPSAVLS